MTRIIKKYANRKLYDPTAKKYMTLEDVAQLVQQGETIQVIDNTNGQDITNVVLSSIILESAKKEEAVVPDTMLIGLIQKRGEAVMETLKKSVAAGVEAAEIVQKEVEKRIKGALEKGREQADTVAAIIESIQFMAKDVTARVQKAVEETVSNSLSGLLASMDIPSRRELERLETSINVLSQQVERLVRQSANKSKKQKSTGPARHPKKTISKARKK
ncbi:MAG: polyhydroxyalkanoate synthesis regulator DNA-binding domain-containing protein [Acidobacteriota bacterium]|nr:phasin family protein [Blastocatellia bacterium]MDW8239695.1 polyhydroxyalkanoate synthesis regulator DNA-binding domain-containing protein [Acidobacteriota bacterium]